MAVVFTCAAILVQGIQEGEGLLRTRDGHAPEGSSTDVAVHLSIALDLCQHLELDAEDVQGLLVPLPHGQLHHVSRASVRDVCHKYSTCSHIS